MFIDHKKWLVYVSKRKAKLLGEYVATLPENHRQKVCDLIAPDAKDLGIDVPTNMSKEALAPELCGFSRVSLSVPRKMRVLPAFTAKLKDLKAKDVEVKLPGPKDPVEVESEGGGFIFVKKAPTKVNTVKNRAAALPPDSKVKIDDEWCEMECKDADIKVGWVKAKHTLGRLHPGCMSKLKDAGGNGSVMVRKECKQEEGKNSLGFVDDDTAIRVINHWFEITWDKIEGGAGLFGGGGAVAAGRGFVLATNIPDNDVILTGKVDGCMAVAKELETALGGFTLHPKKIGGVKADEKGKGRGRGRGRGRG